MFYKYQEEDTFFFSPDEVFQVVLDVEKYPEFIPWCKAVCIKKKFDNKMTVDLLAVFYGIKGQYTSEITSTPPDKTSTGLIVVKSSNGIFKHLYNQWQFVPISENKSIVKFYIEFKFKSDALSILLNSVYMYAQRKIIAAFRNRVQECHKKKSS